MAKLFTITEGLENLGVLKTGGQGSVYKGRRTGDVFTAIKLLPTPIHSESEEDRNYRDFMNEVAKLRKANEVPNPNVVKFMHAGITDTGNFPFIEMEFIEGPDLEELLKPPHDPLFTIREAIRVAEHLSHALAHCHARGIRHGDIKSNNVKYNIHSGNYVLLDFGLALMPDEQRRTSLRHAGAIEFMAPEQGEGKMLAQTDVYSFGVVLYELLGGRVPFPLADRGETARNRVMLAHMETPPPALSELRRQNLPGTWPPEKKMAESSIPAWLLQLVAQCLEKDPARRFASGVELHAFVNRHITAPQQGLDRPLSWNAEKEALERQLQDYRQRISALEGEIALHESRAGENMYRQPARGGIAPVWFYSLLLVTSVLAAFAAYTFIAGDTFREPYADRGSFTDTTGSRPPQETPYENEATPEDTQQFSPPVPAPAADTTPHINVQQEPAVADTTTAVSRQKPDSVKTARYKVREKAYFHNEAEEATRREAYILHWNNAVLDALEEKDGFIYVEYTNHLGQVSKGWLRKEDLVRIEE